MPDNRTPVEDLPDDDELSMSEVAQRLGLNVSTVRAWVSEGLLQTRQDSRDGRRRMVLVGDLKQLLRDHPMRGRPRQGTRRDVQLLGDRPSGPPREGTQRHAADVLKNGLPL